MQTKDKKISHYYEQILGKREILLSAIKKGWSETLRYESFQENS